MRAKYSGDYFPTESAWWRDVHEACQSDGENWFDAGSNKLVRMGNSTSFWHEDWTGSGSFRSKFFRLYHLSKLKWSTVNECGNWVNGAWQWNLKWRRPLLGREQLWAECLMSDLAGIRLVEDSFDRWSWLVSGDGIYSVHSAYLFLQGSNSLAPDQVFSAVWKSLAPSKVKAFAWRILLDRIASKENLLKRRVLVVHDQATCSFCSAHLESCWHLLFSCPVSNHLWQLGANWLGMDLISASSPREHFTQFKVGRNSTQRRASLSVWLATVWTLWLGRNSIVFRSTQFNHEEALDLVKRHSWSWIKANIKGFCYSLYDWYANPLSCIQSL
ncbi:uncharacterized protein LOC130710037 [Lotus japonicus]|uniref:uncharacterized protein LOC130710037 n=1 Tax=Lotus japonicus TaxID=34305 RepID=UPI002584E570|nr:uncharacterized protein LOC130710037 [Lotus japonicus]